MVKYLKQPLEGSITCGTAFLFHPDCRPQGNRASGQLQVCSVHTLKANIRATQSETGHPASCLSRLSALSCLMSVHVTHRSEAFCQSRVRKNNTQRKQRENCHVFSVNLLHLLHRIYRTQSGPKSTTVLICLHLNVCCLNIIMFLSFFYSQLISAHPNSHTLLLLKHRTTNSCNWLSQTELGEN